MHTELFKTQSFTHEESDTNVYEGIPLDKELHEVVWNDAAAFKQIEGERLRQLSESGTEREEEREVLQYHEDTHRIAKASVETEEILAWFRGSVVEVRGKVFVAELTDLGGVPSVAEVERRSVGHAQQGDIRVGASFIYFVSRLDTEGGAETKSSIQFLPPYLWSSTDQGFIEKRIAEIYGPGIDSSTGE